MKIKEQTRKLAVGCSKHCFEVVDKTDEVSSKHCFEVVDRTDEVSNHTYGKVNLQRFEESINCLLEKEPSMKVYQYVNIVTCDQDFHVYLNGILAVKDSQIIYVGQENPEILEQAKQIIDYQGAWIMPGLITSHNIYILIDFHTRFLF